MSYITPIAAACIPSSRRCVVCRLASDVPAAVAGEQAQESAELGKEDAQKSFPHQPARGGAVTASETIIYDVGRYIGVLSQESRHGPKHCDLRHRKTAPNFALCDVDNHLRRLTLIQGR